MGSISRKTKKCKQTRKTAYPNEKLAGKGLMYMRSHDPSADIFDLHVYKCEHGEHFHIGHRSYYEKLQERIHENFSQVGKI